MTFPSQLNNRFPQNWQCRREDFEGLSNDRLDNHVNSVVIAGRKFFQLYLDLRVGEFKARFKNNASIISWIDAVHQYELVHFGNMKTIVPPETFNNPDLAYDYCKKVSVYFYVGLQIGHTLMSSDRRL